jgi:hypothetical protein
MQDVHHAMQVAESQVSGPAGKASAPASLWNCGAVLLGALIAAWPAFWNGFALLYPDSMTYLADGRIVARALFLHEFSEYYGMRSFFYSLVILPLHWNITLWPVVALQCLLTAYIVWMVVRSFTSRSARSFAPRRTILPYLALMLLLAAFSGMSWYSSMIMADFLGPVLYLSIYLLVFARETLTRAERFSLYPIAGWAIASHSTHLLLSGVLWLVLALPLLFNRRDFRRRLRPVIEFAAIITLAVGAQLALNAYLYGTPSLDPDRPPFLTARIIADGPGRLYLQKHCGEVKWVICQHIQNLPGDVDNFLWAPDGIVQSSSDDDQELMLQQEMPFVVATLRAYPLQQFKKSTANAWDQLQTFDFNDLGSSKLVLNDFNPIIPLARPSYEKSRQAHDQLGLNLFTSIQNWTVLASLAVIAGFVPLLWRRHSRRIVGLGMVIVPMVVANAAVTGALSMVEGRFECRVIWLVPLMAGMCVLEWLENRPGERPNFGWKHKRSPVTEAKKTPAV